MENVNIEQTKSTPKIEFNVQEHTHSIIGESYPENTSSFYEPVFSWLREYLETLEDQPAVFNIELTYFNSSSSKTLMDIFDMFEEACEEGKTITVNWIYDEEDEASEEYGEEFAEDVESLIFNVVKK